VNQAPDHAKLLAQAVDIYEFRVAVPEDIEHLVGLYGEYFAESYLPGMGLVYDPKRAWSTLYRHISKGDNPHLIAVEKKTSKLVGAVSYNINHDFTTEPFANLDKLYVLPKWRKSAVGRVLMTLCLEIARADKAIAFNAPLNSGLAETRSAANMLAKLGFEMTDAVIMTRRF